VEQVQFNLDDILLDFSKDGNSKDTWTIRQAVEGVQIFGGIGSGKTSGSGKKIAEKYLLAPFGGLVLTTKPDEKNMWIEYCKTTGREKDLIIVEPGGEHFFNFLEYESAKENGETSFTDNIVQVLKTVIQAGEEKSSGKSDDAFWENALDMLLFSTIDLCKLAYGKVTVPLLYNLALTSPKGKANEEEANFGDFEHALKAAKENINEQVSAFISKLSTEERRKLNDTFAMDNAIVDAIPDAAALRLVDQFFNGQYSKLGETTRSTIEFSFSGFLFRLLGEPVKSLFCNKPSTFKPEDCLEGKIIILNLPVKVFHKVGRDCQVMFKYIWQRAMEKRDISKNGRPVFLWADEAQNFLHAYDAECQATARSSRIATVCISQNTQNYHANMGGIKSEYRVKSFLGTLATQIFHANTDIETNKYASELIGDGYYKDVSQSFTMSEDYSETETSSMKSERRVRPEQFMKLKTGGKPNNGMIEAYMVIQGNGFSDGLNHKKVNFLQPDYFTQK